MNLSEPIHFSRLKYMAQSPAHYKYAVEHERPDTRSFRLGRAVHAALLGGPLVLVWEGSSSRRGAKFDAFKAEHPDAIILIESEMDVITEMIYAVRNNETAMELLDGTHELELEWSWLGRQCAGRIDAVGPNRIVELKSDRCAEPGRFVRSGIRYGYHAQCWWYSNAVLQSGLGTAAESYVIAVESAPPYPVSVLCLTDRALDIGQRMCRAWMERLLTCEASNRWPEYFETIVPFDVPDDEFTLTIEGEEVEV